MSIKIGCPLYTLHVQGIEKLIAFIVKRIFCGIQVRSVFSGTAALTWTTAIVRRRALGWFRIIWRWNETCISPICIHIFSCVLLQAWETVNVEIVDPFAQRHELASFLFRISTPLPVSPCHSWLIGPSQMEVLTCTYSRFTHIIRFFSFYLTGTILSPRSSSR